LIKQKAITETDLLKALGTQFGMEFIPSIPVEDLKIDFTEKLPIQFVKKYGMLL